MAQKPSLRTWSAGPLRRWSKQRLGAVEKNPARGDVLVGAPGHVAPMRVSVGRRRDEQRARAGRDSAILVQELGLTLAEVVVEIDGPEHDAVQRLPVVHLRIELAMPVGVGTLAGD